VLELFANGNFRCGGFRDPEDSPRTLVIPLPFEDSPIGDLANAIFLREQ
jgi:hypothetical protein